MDQVDQHRPAAGLAPPGHLEVVVGLEPGGHRVGGHRPADAALRHPGARRAHAHAVAALVAHQQRHAGRLGAGAQPLGGVQRVGDGLFHQHRQAARDAVQPDGRVRRVGRGHQGRAWPHAVEQLGMAGEPGHADRLGERPPGRCRVGDAGQRHVGMAQHAFGMGPADATGTDQRDRQAGRAHFSGEKARGTQRLLCMAVRLAGPPLGGHTPWATASARIFARASTLS